MKLWKGNVFTSLCQEFCLSGGMHGRGTCVVGGVWWGACVAGESAIRIFITETEPVLHHLFLWLRPVDGLFLSQTVSFTTCSVTNEGKHKHNTKKLGSCYLENYTKKLHKNVEKDVCTHHP